MRVALTMAFAVLLVECFETPPKSKDETNPVESPVESSDGKQPQQKKEIQPYPAILSYSGCKLKKGALSKCKTSSNKDIQMGEAWANPRVHGQVFAVFVPKKPGEGNYASQGGPYGLCAAWDCHPTEKDLEPSKNPAAYCFFWDPKDTGRPWPEGCDPKIPPPDPCIKPDKNKKPDKKPGGGGGGGGKPSTCPAPRPTKIPGEPGFPMPVVCPSNLKPCYSAAWYQPGGKLAKYADCKPTYKGQWFPLKENGTWKPLYCEGLNLGCGSPTNFELQLQYLLKKKCDVSTCKKPPPMPPV